MGKPIRISLPVLIIIFHLISYAQFPPPAGQEGSTAIHKDSSAFIDWAASCSVERGLKDISQPDSGYVNSGSSEFATGIADNLIVSLGDGGSATLTFDVPIANGPGFDFAVFENAFIDTFLELAFVEVSSDGINFFRFDAISLTQTETQVGTFGELDATQINNLAGKYRVLYGTPFDLEELKNKPGLNVDSISHIRIIDVVGCIQDEYATYDSQGNKVNDPFPTPFPSGGFDLDAVGVIYNLNNAGIKEINKNIVTVYPNPVKDVLNVEYNGEIRVTGYNLYDVKGNLILKEKIIDQISANIRINIGQLRRGIYFLNIIYDNGFSVRKIIKQ